MRNMFRIWSSRKLMGKWSVGRWVGSRWSVVLIKPNINSNILNPADTTVTKTLLFGTWKYSNKINLQILNASIDFVLISKRFDEPLKFLRRDQVNLLVYRPDRLYFQQKQKKLILQNFCHLAFFIIYCFLLFEKRKKRNKT